MGGNGFDPTQNREGGEKRGDKEKRSAWHKVTDNSLIEVKTTLTRYPTDPPARPLSHPTGLPSVELKSHVA